MLLAAFALNGAHAQDNTNLNKEITLEKDIAPLEKKAVKKNELPTSIPTLLPYGYRTAHNFSNQRGYLDMGAGTQANFRVDFGYRILNEEREKLGVWFNHNSSWNSKSNNNRIKYLQCYN